MPLFHALIMPMPRYAPPEHTDDALLRVMPRRYMRHAILMPYYYYCRHADTDAEALDAILLMPRCCRARRHQKHRCCRGESGGDYAAEYYIESRGREEAVFAARVRREAAVSHYRR